jgi:hypothetical protein
VCTLLDLGFDLEGPRRAGPYTGRRVAGFLQRRSPLGGLELSTARKGNFYGTGTQGVGPAGTTGGGYGGAG